MYACVFAAPDRAIAMETKDLTHAKLGEDGEATVDSRRHVKEEGRGFMSSNASRCSQQKQQNRVRLLQIDGPSPDQ